MAAFKPTRIIAYKKVEQQLTPDNVYWIRLKEAATIQKTGHVTAIDFDPTRPRFAATSSAKVELYEAGTCEVAVTFSKFKSSAYGGVFREDGNLVAAGGEEGVVRLFDSAHATREAAKPLRAFKGHEGAVHCCSFTAEKTTLASFGEDGCVKGWDLSSAESNPIYSMTGHTDHIRAGCATTSSPSLLISGSYDHSCKVWDSRSPSDAVLTVSHGAPVESLLLFPGDSLLASAGGTAIRIWDLAAGGRQLAQVSQHHRTITGLRLCSDGRRFLSAGLDKHIKVYDVATYEVVHTLTSPAPILSFGVSKDDSVLAVGMAGSGLLSIQRREPDYRDTKKTEREAKGGGKWKLNAGAIKKHDTVVGERERTNLSRYDHYLKSFQYSRALSYAVTSKYFSERRPEVVVSLLKELSRSGALRRCLAGRDYATLGPLIRFLSRNLGKPRFAEVLLGTCSLLLDVYTESAEELEGPTIAMLKHLQSKLKKELAEQRDILEATGAIELLIEGAAARRSPLAPPSPSTGVFGPPAYERITLDEKS